VVPRSLGFGWSLTAGVGLVAVALPAEGRPDLAERQARVLAPVQGRSSNAPLTGDTGAGEALPRILPAPGGGWEGDTTDCYRIVIELRCL
jgi:hypothetical protein